jgi:hypothetical protein
LVCYEFEVLHMHVLKTRQSGWKMNLYIWHPVKANTCCVLICKITVMIVSWIAMMFHLIANQSTCTFWRDMNWALLLGGLCFISPFQVQNYMYVESVIWTEFLLQDLIGWSVLESYIRQSRFMLLNLICDTCSIGMFLGWSPIFFSYSALEMVASCYLYISLKG